MPQMAPKSWTMLHMLFSANMVMMAMMSSLNTPSQNYKDWLSKYYELKMMTNLFSVFDPSSSMMSTPMNWASSLIGMVVLPSMFLMIPTRWSMLWANVANTLYKEFKTLLCSYSITRSTFMFVSLFSMITFINY